MFKRIGCGILLLLAGCQDSQHGVVDRGDYLADRSYQAQGVDQRIRFIILHYTAENEAGSLRILTRQKVSAHYLVAAEPDSRQGKPVVWQLADENQRAWHAGASYWQGRTNLNDTSIGIEIVNAGPLAGGWAPFAPAQIALVSILVKDIAARYAIPPQNILGHMDVAPERKQDPGPAFPWRQLAAKGVGAWPDEYAVRRNLNGRPVNEPVQVSRLLRKLARYGYNAPLSMNEEQARLVIAAFQMHFRPADYQGYADAESEAIVDALLEKYGERE